MVTEAGHFCSAPKAQVALKAHYAPMRTRILDIAFHSVIPTRPEFEVRALTYSINELAVVRAAAAAGAADFYGLNA